jgi:hypothetical protein
MLRLAWYDGHFEAVSLKRRLRGPPPRTISFANIRRQKMKRTTLTASLVGSAAAGLIAAAIATPAWAQATTYPEGTDCSAIQNSSNRTDCMNQMNESRQKQDPGTNVQTPAGNIQGGNPDQLDNTQQPGDPAGSNPANNNPAGTTGGGSQGTGTGGANNSGTNAPGNGTNSQSN